MIPVRLQLRGFLSYKDMVDLSFEGFDLACISGDNGAGKSSLLDAVTWVLFGKARRSDDGVINNTCDETEVIFLFNYENDLYRVQRMKARNRSVVLEFQIRDGEDAWKPLTEHTVAETQNRICEILHLDYETFINTSFFLQGKADEFTQKNSAQRKEILASILGLDVWEGYREVARELRRNLESRTKTVEGSMHEIEEELAQEEQRKKDYLKATTDLELYASQRVAQQQLFEQARQVAVLLEEQRKMLEAIEAQRSALVTEEQQIAERIKERLLEEADLKKKADQEDRIIGDFQERTELKERLQALDSLSGRYFDLQQQKAACEKTIAMEESRLKQELLSLEKEKRKIQQMREERAILEDKRGKLSTELLSLRPQVDQLDVLKKQAEEFSLQRSSLLAENKNLNDLMQKLKERLVRLKEEKGTACPLCGQFLSEDHRQQVTDEIEKDGKAAADTYRKNEEQLAQLSERLNQLNKDITRINTLESRMRVIERDLGIAENEIERSEKEIAFWMEKGEPQLAEIQKNLLEERFAQNIREQTAQIIGEMGKLGYDPQLHAVLRQKEQSGRGIEQSYQDLMIAKNRLEPLGREIATLRTRQRAIQNDMEDLAQKQQKTDQHYRELEQGLPDLHLLEQHLQELIKLENQQRAVVGGALQMLEVIERQKERKQRITQELTKFSKQQTYIQILEKTFGRDGIQAMLIEEVLPQMEMQANDTLSRLSSGSMSVRFETERDYKDKKRDDKMQVLDILINDAEGVQRTYDLFSGGEAFRINFAIRLALSKVLAQRAGARLQLLVIDEGFGSQDAEGRQKLIEAINLIRPDFKKILIITHLEELKDAFQARIEVQKTRRGSQVEVVVQ